MFAAHRPLKHGGDVVFQTPLLVPSFSSKGFPNVRGIINNLSQYITEATLVSAYDIHHNFIRKKYNFASVLFIDSGGYEATVDHDLSDPKRNDHKPRHWNQRFYRRIVAGLGNPVGSRYVIVNYDNPTDRRILSKQITRAEEDFRNVSDGRMVTEFLIKPDPGKKHLDITVIQPKLAKLKQFSVLGVTEKELGDSALKRMLMLGKLRKEMSALNMSQPLHVFGALDPIAVPLYFFAGADVFDGLTWLRYGLSEGGANYINNYAQLKYGLDMNDESALTRVWVDNLVYISSLQRNMRTFLKRYDYEVFGHNKDYFKRCVDDFEAEFDGGE